MIRRWLVRYLVSQFGAESIHSAAAVRSINAAIAEATQES